MIASLLGQHSDALMELLPVSAPLHGVHHNIFTGHKRQFLQHVLLNHLGMDYQSRGHVGPDIQNGIHRQKGLGDTETLVGRVVQGSLKPLGAGHQHGIHHITHHIIGQGSNPFTPHGIPLICHGRRTDLVFLKRLLHLL